MRRFAGRTGCALLLAAALPGAGCYSPTDGSGMPRGERERLEQNLALWRSQGLTSYRFQYQHRCFCPPAVTDPVSIVVRGGEIVSVTYVATGQAVPPERFEQYLTVDALFVLARQALDEAASVTIGYDASYGYPARVDVDWRREIADDEGFHQAANLQPLR
jgi:Family of unknown function (DUF6174)